MQFKQKRKKDINLDITPIVDTVFNLLIFFALSLNFTTTSSLHVNLPEITSGAPSAHVEQLTLQINESGEIYLNQVLVEIDALAQMLHTLGKKTPTPGIIIQADRFVPHGKVVQIMDICKKSGFKKLAIAAFFK